MTLRVVQWATGGLGQAAIGQIQLHPELELVGVWVHSEAKAGKDAGELAGLGPIGITATSSMDDVIALAPDCVLYSPLMPNPKEVATLLRAGINVVTPLGWFWPTPEEKARMEAPALEGGVTLHGTGIDPGGATEQQPLFFAGLSSAITFVRGEEYSDIRTYNAPDVVRHIMGFGQSPEEAMNGPMLALLDNGFDQSVRMCLDTLGFAEAEIRSSREVAVATAPIDSPIGEIQPGQVAAQRFAWEAYVGEAKVVRVAVNWLMGDEHLDPPWKYGEGGVRFEVEVKGDPDCHVTIHGWHPTSVAAGLERNPGIVVTAAHCVNSIPYVCAADPGLLTFVDMPLVTGRAHPDLAR